MGDQLTEGERLMRLETRLDSMEQLMIRVDTKLDAWNEAFLPRREAEAKFTSVEKEIAALQQKQQSTWSNLPFWISSICAVVAIVIAIWPKVK